MILKFLLTVKISYLLFFTYVKSSRSTITWKENLPNINKIFSSSFSSTSPAIRMPKWQQLDNEVFTWFPQLHRIEQACEYLSRIYHCFIKWIDFRLITSLIWKKKATLSEMWLLRGVLQRNFPRKFSKFTEKYLCGNLFLTILKFFHVVRLATLFEKDLLTGV